MISIHKTQFRQNTAEYGGALHVKQASGEMMRIAESTFHNEAEHGGAVDFNDPFRELSNFKIEDSNFDSNQLDMLAAQFTCMKEK